MQPPEWQAVQRILTICLGGVEQVRMLSSALRRLRHALPTATIALMISETGRQAIARLPWVDCVLLYPASDLDPTTEQALIEALRLQKFDAAIFFTSPSESPYALAYMAYLAGIPIRVGQSEEFGGSVLSHWLNPSDPAHSADRHLFLIESIVSSGERQLERMGLDEAESDRLAEI